MKAIPVLLLMCATAIPTPAPAQSMNVRRIVDSVMGDVCAPYARDGDIARAVRAAEGLGYRVVEDRSALLLDRDPPSGLAHLYRQHAGTVSLSLSYGRGLCAVGIAEGSAATMGEAAEPHMRALGLEPVRDVRERAPTTDIVVWKGGTTQLVISPSPHHTPGSELVLSFVVPAP